MLAYGQIKDASQMLDGYQRYRHLEQLLVGVLAQS
jgi:hypothetical protein